MVCNVANVCRTLNPCRHNVADTILLHHTASYQLLPGMGSAPPALHPRDALPRHCPDEDHHESILNQEGLKPSYNLIQEESTEAVVHEVLLAASKKHASYLQPQL